MEHPTEHCFELSGGNLALDFVNTVGGMRDVRPSEHLDRYADLLAFARQAGSLGPLDAGRLAREADRDPEGAAGVLAEAKALREALYRIFLAAARRDTAEDRDVGILNRALSRALVHRRVVAGAGAWALAWEEPVGLDAPLWPIADAAAALLVSPDLARVRVCGMYDDHECSWVFVDRTKARTRRWCSMKDCGNRAKARRHYARRKCAPDGPPPECPPEPPAPKRGA